MNEQFWPYIRENFDFLGGDREMKKHALSSIKTQNMMVSRRDITKGIIKAIEEEPIENHINEIIRLTEPKGKK